MITKQEIDLLVKDAEHALSLYEVLVGGNRNAYQNAIYSRIRTPLLDDLVLEASGYGRKMLSSGDYNGFGRLSAIEREELHGIWSDRLWRVHPIHQDATHSELWTNCEFIFVMSRREMLTFLRGARNEHAMYPEYNFDVSNERTWWWLVKDADRKKRCQSEELLRAY